MQASKPYYLIRLLDFHGTVVQCIEDQIGDVYTYQKPLVYRRASWGAWIPQDGRRVPRKIRNELMRLEGV